MLIFQSIDEVNSMLWAANVAWMGLNEAQYIEDPVFLDSNIFKTVNGRLYVG